MKIFYNVQYYHLKKTLTYPSESPCIASQLSFTAVHLMSKSQWWRALSNLYDLVQYVVLFSTIHLNRTFEFLYF